MLQHRVILSTRSWRSMRFTSRLSQNSAEDKPVNATAVATTSGHPRGARKPSSILSRLSERTQSRIHADTEQNFLNEAPAPLRPGATSFVSARSARKRDHATEKWFTDVRELDISHADQPGVLKSLPRKRRRFGSPKQHEMRPRTDLNELFAPPSAHSATLLRLQSKKELGGDYASYLPDGNADPHRLPVAYARLVLGRNKYIPLNAQTGALSVVEEVIRGKTTRQAI